MKFHIQWDGRRKTRASKIYGGYGKYYNTINEAIVDLKTMRHPYRICCKVKDGTTITLVLFEGKENTGCFSQAKLKTLVKIGEGMYVPKRLTRKTNIKRKKKCEQSNLLNQLKAYAKSTQ